MKKLLLTTLLLGSLTPQLFLYSMEKEMSHSTTDLYLLNNSGKDISINYSKKEWIQGELRDTIYSSLLPAQGAIRIAQPLMSLTLCEFGTFSGEQIPTEKLTAIADSPAEMVIGYPQYTMTPSGEPSEKVSSFYYEINEPKTLRVFNDSEKKITVTFSTYRGGKPFNKEVNPKETVRLTQPICSLYVRPTSNKSLKTCRPKGKLNEITDASAEIGVPKEKLDEIRDASAEIVVHSQNNTDALSYKLTAAKMAFKSTFSDSSKEEIIDNRTTDTKEAPRMEQTQGARLDIPSGEQETRTTNTEGAGLDIHSGDQRNCIVS